MSDDVWMPPQKWDKDKLEMAKTLARRTLSVRHYMNKKQREFYDMWKDPDKRQICLWCARKSGKSFTSLLLAYEYAWNNPNTITRYIAPTLKTAREVVIPITKEFKDILPEELLPAVKKAELKLVFRNGAEIHLGGASMENIEGSRGPITHGGIFLDECAAYPDGDDYMYVTRSVLFPQLTTTDGKVIYLTTPPKSPNHIFFTQEFMNLKDSDCVVSFTIDDNPLLSPERVKAIEKLYGGRESKDFRREYLLELIPNDNGRIVPEYDDMPPTLVDADALLEEWKEDEVKLQSFIVTDYGNVDLTATLAIVYNTFTRQALVLREWSVKGGASEFVSNYKEAYDYLWKAVGNYDEIKSILDCFEQARTLFKDAYGLQFDRPRKKRKKEDAVTDLRDKIRSNKILIGKGCKILRSMLLYGEWDNLKADNKKFARSENLHHLDHVDALIYAMLAIRWTNANVKNDLNLLGG